MTFDEALCKMRAGARIRRKRWNGTGCLYIVSADEIEQIRAQGRAFNKHRPIVMSVDGKTRAWTPSQAEILADDWVQL